MIDAHQHARRIPPATPRLPTDAEIAAGAKVLREMRHAYHTTEDIVRAVLIAAEVARADTMAKFTGGTP